MTPSGPHLSRRKVLRTLAASSAAMLAHPGSLFGAAAASQVETIVAATIAVDMHSHVQIRLNSTADPEIDLAGQMRRSGFSAVCQTYAVDGVISREPGAYYQHLLQQLAFQDRLLAKNSMRRALTLKDLETAHRNKQPIIVQSTEGAQFLDGKLERIAEVYERGMRHLQLLHEQDDVVSPIGDVYTAPAPHLGGLTPFGAQVIRECNRIGMLVDLAHGTSETILAALKVASAPLIVSHTGIVANSPGKTIPPDIQRRLIRKDVAAAVASNGGVIGVWWRMSDTIGEYVTTVRTMVDAAGIDHVGIGTDSDLTASYVLPYTNQIWPDQNAGFFYAVAGEMLKQGFSADEISKFGGGNFCRVFDKVTANHA